jgi:GDP-4-dehydro-6-deoxy-D-mannose reductase
MRILVTGADGFVGKHLVAALRDDAAEVIAAGGPAVPGGIDLQSSESVSAKLRDARPDVVVHLAAVSSVSRSHRHPIETLAVNALGTTILLDAAHRECPRARLLVVGSGEVYGRSAGAGAVGEDAPLEPLSPYAASKVAAEAVALQFHRSYGMDVVCARSFAALGAGQATDFAIPSFASQIAAIKRRQAPAVLHTGDMTPVRDFLHVQDVVSAYRVLVKRGVAGAAYNVASGAGCTLRSLLDDMLTLASVEAEVKVDPARLRPVELPMLVGDASRLRRLGWAPVHTVEEALRDVLAEHGAL